MLFSFAPLVDWVDFIGATCFGIIWCVNSNRLSASRRMRRENPYSEAGQTLQLYERTAPGNKNSGEDKWAAKPAPPIQPAKSAVQQENENEYASMRLLPPLPANEYRRQMNPNQPSGKAFPPSSAYPVTRNAFSREHLYESPESMRKCNARVNSEDPPEYFDLDIRMRTPGSCEHVGGQCTCAGQPHRGSLKGPAMPTGETRSSNHVSV